MKTFLLSSTKHLSIAFSYACLGIVVALLAFGIWFLNARPSLSLWHTTTLEHQYRLDASVRDFSQYLQLEDRLFAEVERKVYDKTSGWRGQPLNRYVHGSYADPGKWPMSWNRSYEWPNEKAQFGVLLLHGMSDSPYALSHFAQHFRDQAHLVGLRLPGHGTLPSGLVSVTWQEMAEAVSLATRHMQHVLRGRPLYVVAFSTGAALALNHELERLAVGEDTSYSGLIFLSPAIGLSPVAVGAKWQDRIGRLLGLEKLSWNSIQTEYDPFKYNSFAVNAGDVVYQLARRNQELMRELTPSLKQKLAPILTFQSLSDATVSTPAVVRELYQTLPDNGHQLVLFDINRLSMNLSLVANDPWDALAPLVDLSTPNFDLTLIQNQRRPDSEGEYALVRQVSENRYRPHQDVSLVPLKLSWPKNVYSLSHVALPYPAQDSLYGIGGDKTLYRVQIGAAANRGERGILGVSASEMLRQKWNPFFPYLLSRLDGFIIQQMATRSDKALPSD